MRCRDYGDHITPLISSGLEMAGKIVIAASLVPWLGYTGVIICEPIVWFIMVIPLLIPDIPDAGNQDRKDSWKNIEGEI